MIEIKHLAANLEIGDRVTGTIRHKTDGSLNRHNVELIVISVDEFNSRIEAFDKSLDVLVYVPFDELKQSLIP